MANSFIFTVAFSHFLDIFLFSGTAYPFKHYTILHKGALSQLRPSTPPQL